MRSRHHLTPERNLDTRRLAATTSTNQHWSTRSSLFSSLRRLVGEATNLERVADSLVVDSCSRLRIGRWEGRKRALGDGDDVSDDWFEGE